MEMSQLSSNSYEQKETKQARWQRQRQRPGLKSVREHMTLSIRDLLSQLPPEHTDHCIYRVPDSLRKANPECYTPRLVAIGPLHRDNSRLKPMEECKSRFLKSFLAKTDKVLDIIDFIVGEEPAIRCHYQEEIKLSAEDFSQMIFLDSVFIVELLLKKEEKDHPKKERDLKKEEKDPMFDNRWWFSDLLHDILLIENQVPLFVPDFIYNQYNSGLERSKRREFADLVHSFFKDVKNESYPHFSFDQSQVPLHIIDYLRSSHIPQNQPCPRNDVRKNLKSDAATVSRLLEYGVQLRKEPTTQDKSTLVEIQFDQTQGILTIPQVKVNEWTETLFRNIVAYEQCHHISPRYVSDYIIFMDSLIDTRKDVEILVDKGIIQDDLQDPEKVSELFNNLYKEAITKDRDFFFARQSRELNDYRRDRRHQCKARWYNWKLILKRDYFNSPWTTISFIAAVILLGLTIVQTVCSIYQAKGIKM